MKKMLMFAIAGATLAAATPAVARDGCGPDGHRGPHGNCHPNRDGAVIVAPGVLSVGTFYPGHGYWDGRRYWHHRDRWHNSWRYR